ncbi:MAG: CHAD domain-containing protein [Pleurocapsa minor GSE-CHR-MK-17-07R]|jgi:CHAD domain-containing protein|nr:CHAD domain-containing protein [Pleurocapsa minor GSE-CHR-MK 17-07R]
MSETTPYDTLIDTLKAARQPLTADDTMADAGRKVMLDQLLLLLKHEPGVVEGEDIEEVHDMRVASRRIRSLLRLLNDQYKPKIVRPLEASLRKLARALGEVRDREVMMANIESALAGLESTDVQGQALTSVLEMLAQERAVARYHLLRLLGKGAHLRFYKDFTEFVTNENAGKAAASDVSPVQVRHALPPLIYQHLATVRAYDAVLADAEDEALHQLRIEFKRLRYATTLFDAALGSQIKDFNKELSAMQDHLGTMQDIVTAQDKLKAFAAVLPAEQAEALRAYADAQAAQHIALRESLGAAWKKFNSKSVMGKLGSAVAGM